MPALTQARERLEQFVAQGPAAGQVQKQAAGVAGEPAGDVQELVAQALRLAAGKLAGEQEALRPGEQILGDEDELEPGRVGGERAEGEVAKPGAFAAADPVLDERVGAVELFEPGDPSALLVGDEDLEAVALTSVKESCAPGWGRSWRQIPRVPCSQPFASRSRASSATAAPSRCSPAWVSAGRQPCSGTARIACLTGSVRSKPTEKRKLRAATWSRKACVAPPELVRTSRPGPTASSGSCSSARSSTAAVAGRIGACVVKPQRAQVGQAVAAVEAGITDSRRLAPDRLMNDPG